MSAPRRAEVAHPTLATTATPPPNAGFVNLDFEDVDANGVPAGWMCICAGPVACQTDTALPEHGKRSLVLPSGCIAVQYLSTFDTTNGLRFDVAARNGAVMPEDVAVFGDLVAPDAYSFEQLDTKGLPAAKSEWTRLRSNGAMRTAGEDRLTLILTNSNGELDPTPGATMYYDDVRVAQREPNPPPKVGELLRAAHIDTFGLAPSSSSTTIYLSLPSHWASQVPLYLSDIEVSPPGLVQSVTYATETEGNWGAAVTFAPGAGAPNVIMKWESVALVRSVPNAELPAVYAAETPPATWLAPSDCVESNDPGIASTGSTLAPAGSSALDQMLAILGWTSTNVAYGTANGETGLDATSTYDFLMSTCTGYANLGAAFGRGLGVPSRHVTNMLVGQSQFMHSLDEFYLGSDSGWRRVEPQGAQPRVADDDAFVMRLVMPSDESPVAPRNTPGGSLSLGVPLHEFSEILTNSSAVIAAASPPPTFTDCSACLNRADPQTTLRDATEERMRALFARAQRRWGRSLAEYEKNGRLPCSEQETRRGALSAETIEDVERIVDALE